MNRRHLLRNFGLGLAILPSIQVGKSLGQGVVQRPILELTGPRKRLSVDAFLASPDGVGRSVMGYGGQLMGPTIRVREGERLNITVVNQLQVPTIVHWHGMHQIGTWKMDGVEGVSGPAIAPGETFTYDFIATPGGTHWYHSHAGVQYGNGLFGPLIVEEVKPIARYDRDQVLLFNDWDQQSAEQLWQELSTRGMGAMGGGAPKEGGSMAAGAMAGGAMAGAAMKGAADQAAAKGSSSVSALATRGLDALIAQQWGSPAVDWGDIPFVSGLMNGKGRFPGTSTPLAEVRIREGEVLRLRLINGSSTYSLRFQIDGHPLTVIASDGQPLAPVTVDNLLVGIGERYDVLITGKGSGSHWIRATTCTGQTIQAVLRYRDSDPIEPKLAVKPQANPWGAKFLAPSQLRSPGPVALAKAPYREIPLLIEGPFPVYRWTINGEAYPKTTPIAIKKDEVVRMRFINRTNMEHPFHIHGHSFYVLGAPDELNLNDPPYKDTVNVWPNSELVVLWQATNPGHWIFHCHVEWHIAGGMASLIHIA